MKAIRVLCPPLLLCAALLAPAWAQGGEARSARWKKAFERFDASDAKALPRPGCTVFIGSSSIVQWRQLVADMAPLPAVNRGFGGSIMRDALEAVERYVIRYRPDQVVLYEGDNDTASNIPTGTILGEVEAFVKKVHGALPRTRIFFLSIKPSPARWKLVERVHEANAAIREYCERTKGLEYLDVFEILLASDGKPRASLYADGLHLNRKGYYLWNALVKPVLLHDREPDRKHDPAKPLPPGPLERDVSTGDERREEIARLVALVAGDVPGMEPDKAITALVAMGRQAAPAVVDELVRLDFGTKDGAVMGCILSHLLREMCGPAGPEILLRTEDGEDAWRTEPAIRRNRRAAARWNGLFSG